MTLTATEPLLLAEVFELIEPPPPMRPRFNIAPTQTAPVVLDGPRRLELYRWGLLPPWTKEPRKGPPLINARADGLATKPSFRAAFKTRRCLVAVDGWYEWKAGPDGKDPWRFRRPDGRPFALAGLWESWKDEDGREVRSFCVVTTAPNACAAEIHDRMPVIVPREAWPLWLEPRALTEAEQAALLRACPEDFVIAERASRRVNDARFDGPECLSG